MSDTTTERYGNAFWWKQRQHTLDLLKQIKKHRTRMQENWNVKGAINSMSKTHITERGRGQAAFVERAAGKISAGTKGQKPKSESHLLMEYFLTELNVGWKSEFRFHEARKWRFDFAIPESRIACEVDGGVFVAGRHTRGVGFQNDCEKVNTATAMGWRVFRFTPRDVKTGKAKEFLARALLLDRLGELKQAVRRADRSGE